MDAILTAIKTIESNLAGLITLSDEERDNLPRFGDKSVAFVEKSHEYGQQTAELYPSYFSLDEMGKDIKARADLLKIKGPLSALLEKIDDTFILSGAEAYVAALHIFAVLKKADHDGVPGLRGMVDDLQKRFPGRGQSKKAPTV